MDAPTVVLTRRVAELEKVVKALGDEARELLHVLHKLTQEIKALRDENAQLRTTALNLVKPPRRGGN